MAWVRGDAEELIVASDSRLRAGYAWDTAPKILPLPRNDAVVAFAGTTEIAYPMMIQAVHTVSAWERAFNRGQPLEDLKGHLIRVFNHMLDQMTDRNELQGSFTPDAIFLLAGFSWKTQEFRIWTVHWDASISRFTFRRAGSWRAQSGRHKIGTLVGDEVAKARDILVEKLRAKGRLSTGGFDWEPLEVLVQLIEDPSCPTIGGSPQVVKIYKSLKVVPFTVPWKQADGTPVLTVLGRPLLDYESPNRFPRLPLDLTKTQEGLEQPLRRRTRRRKTDS